MSQKERVRLVMMSRVEEKAMTIKEVAEVMGISYRQGRVDRRYVTEGDKGLIHRNRGRPWNRSKSSEFKEIVLALYREQYWYFGPTLAAEKLAEEDGYEVEPRDAEAMASGGKIMEETEEARQAQTTARAEGPLWRAGPDGWQSPQVV